MMYAIQPAADACQSAFGVFVNLDIGGPFSAAQVLTAALFTFYSDKREATEIYSQLAAITRELSRSSTSENDYAPYLKIALRVLLQAAQRGAVSPETLRPLAETMGAQAHDSELTDLIRQLSSRPDAQQSS
jgi:hypothetical protein